jgi:NDP-sugar pyrophosphorylase family protein
VQAVILASGHGSRFAPLTDQVPKPLLPAANWPFLDYLLTAVSQLEFSEVFVTLGYGATQLNQFLEKVTLQHRITPIDAPNWKQGPLASFQAVLPHLAHDSPFVLLPGDLYLSPDILHLIFSKPAEVALLYDPVATHPGTLLQLDNQNAITQLTQSAVHLPDFHPVLPVLRGSRRFFTDALALHASPPRTVFDLLQNWLAHDLPLVGIPIRDGVWFDVDSPADLIALNYHLLTQGWPPTPRPPGTYLPAGTAMKGPVQSSTLTLGAEAMVEGPALLGAGVCIAEGGAVRDGTSLGSATTVQRNASLTRCLTLPNTQVPANVDLRDAILDVHGNVVR